MTTKLTLVGASLAIQRQGQEVLIPGSDRAWARQLQRRAQAGELRRIAAGVYVQEGSDQDIAQRILRHWQSIAAHFAPGAVLSHLSAMRGGLLDKRYVTLSHPTNYNRTLKLPGLELVLIKGPGPLPGDVKLHDSGLYWAGTARTLLENLGRVQTKRPTRGGPALVEEKLVSELNASGEHALNRLRDEARQLASQLDMQDAFEQFSATVSGLLKTRQSNVLRTRQGQLVAQGTPADASRLRRFQLLADALRATTLPALADAASAEPAKAHFAFLESYFSNYVEGTKFSIEEAEGIVLRGAIVQSRPKDSHDVLGVFHLAMTSPNRDSVPPPGDAFAEGLMRRHGLMLERRPEARPGQLKREVNYAGSTEFVLPEHVRGTLSEGSRIALTVPEGLARAVFYAFLVSEVHPFDDGNGRLSRLTMNAELSRVGSSRLIIPTLFHPQYIDCQRALTRGDDPQPFIRCMSYAAQWCNGFDYTKLPAVLTQMKAANAFEEDPQNHKLREGPLDVERFAALDRAQQALSAVHAAAKSTKPNARQRKKQTRTI